MILQEEYIKIYILTVYLVLSVSVTCNVLQRNNSDKSKWVKKLSVNI